MINFTYYNPAKIIFGRGTEPELAREIQKYGKKVLLHYGGGSIFQNGVYHKVTKALKEAGISYIELGGVKPNPRLSLVREGVKLCREQGVDVLLAVGGGSVIDSAKAIAVGVPYQGDVWDFFAGKAQPQTALPVVTVLTIPAAGEAVVAGLPCIRVADLSRLQVRAQSPELYAGELAAGQRANVTASAAGDAVYGAQVDSVSPVAVRAMSLTGQSGEATVETILSLCGDTEGLRPGYSASVKIFTEYHPDAVVVPHEAVCQRGEQEYVFCVENGRAVQCPVTTGYMLETVTEIVEGLAPDAAVVLSPSDTLTDGAPVEVAA